MTHMQYATREQRDSKTNFGAGAKLFHAAFGKKWCAGPTVNDAIQRAFEEKKRGRVGNGVLVNCLGEHLRTGKEVRETMGEYELLVHALAGWKSKGIEGAATMKPTQFGLDVVGVACPEAYARDNIEFIARLAAGKGIRVWLDMEGSATTDFTLNLYKMLLKRYGNVGIALQANLKRTPGDLEELMLLNDALVRLIKGIYKEAPAHAFVTNAEIHAAFAGLIRMAFKKSPRTFGIAVGSHHAEKIREAVALQQQYEKEYFAIQMLMGVMPKLLERLVENGIPSEEYIPYGEREFPYSVRRSRESPSFALGIVRALFLEGKYVREYEQAHEAAQAKV